MLNLWSKDNTPQIEKKPTFAQEEYAKNLVERMQEEHMIGAKFRARQVMSCQNRQEMARLINKMKCDLEQADAFIADDL